MQDKGISQESYNRHSSPSFGVTGRLIGDIMFHHISDKFIKPLTLIYKQINVNVPISNN